MPTPEIKTNKLNVYLIKDAYSSEDSITKISTNSSIQRIELKDIGIFYFEKSNPRPPEWLKTFFNDHPDIDKKNFFGAGSRAVLVVKVEHGKRKRFFAIPFGDGRFLLQDDCKEERFGLITTLNILESTKIRAIDKRTLTTNPKNSREQIARASEAFDFQIDFETDLIQSITGLSVDKEFGKTITGKESLNFSAKIDTSNVREFLKKSLNIYEKKDYKTNFGWIDQIQEVKDKAVLDKLDKKLLTKLNNKDANVWLAPPDILDWSDWRGFKYSKRKTDDLYDDLTVHDLLAQNGGTISDIDSLRFDNFITSWPASTEDYKENWSAYRCLNAEVDIGKKKFFLSTSKWYEIDSTFVDEVNKAFSKIKQVDLGVGDYNHADENAFNLHVASKLNGLCLDAENIVHGGGRSRIEFCDVLTRDKKLIHVKKYGGSSVLSHLFAQGFVSAELLKLDEEFRQKLIDKVKEASTKFGVTGFVPLIPLTAINAGEFTIYYVIINSQKGSTLSIPFFSKVALKNSKKILDAYGFNLRLCKVRNVKPPKPKTPKAKTSKSK